MRYSRRALRRIGVAACSAALAFSASARAATKQWSATGTSTAWATSGNWVGNLAPVNDLVTDTALFDSTSYAFQPNTGTTNVNGIQVGDGFTAAAALTISGTTLGIGNGGLNILAGAGAVTLSPTTLNLGANLSLTNNASTAFIVNSNAINSGTSPVTLTLNGTGSGGTTYNGKISDGTGPATTALAIAEAGQVVLAGTDTFTGGTTIYAGSTVVVSGTTAFGSGPLTLNGPGIVKLRSTNGSGKTIANAVNWGSDVEFYTATSNDKALTFSSPVTLSGATRTITLDPLTAAAVETIQGAVSSSGNTNLVIVNNGSFVGEGIAFTGGINNSGTITNTGTGTDATTISSPIGANVTGIVQNSTTSTLVLSGNNSAFAGAITVGSGTLQLGDGTNGTLPSSQAVTVGGGGSLNYVGVTTGSTQNLGTLTFSGDGTVQSTYDGTSGNTVLSFSALTPRASGVTGTFITAGGTNGTAAGGGNNAITLGGVPTGVMGPAFFFDGGTANASYAFYDVGGFVRGISYGVDANSATTAGSTTGLPAGTYLQMTGTVTGQNTAAVSTLNISGASPLALNDAQTLTVGGIFKSGANAAAISGGAGIQAPAGGELVIRSDQSGDALTITTPILDNAASSLTKAGPGSLTLSAANAYTGVTTIDNGIVAINTEGAVGAGGSLGVTPMVGTPGDVVLNGGTLKATAGLVLNANRGIALGANGGTLAAGTSNFEIDGVITGTAALTIASGSGNYVPRGLSTYSGGTTLASGSNTIPVSDSTGADGAPTSGPFGTGTLNFAGGAMRATTSTDINIQNPLTLSASTTFLSGAATSLTFTGPVTLANATPTLTNSGSAPGYVGFSGAIGDGGSNFGLKTAGSGTIVFSGASTYSGVTTVTAGTFVAANTTGSATGTGAVTVTGGTLASAAVGTIGGVVTSATAANTIAPGGIGGVGTLNVGGLVSSSGTTLNLDETAPWNGSAGNTGDLLNITGGIFSTPAAGLKVAIGDTPSAPGNYRLIGYSGASGLTAANFSLPTAPTRTTYTPDFGSVDPGYVDLIVSNTGTVTSTWTGTTATASWAASSNPPWDTGIYPSISGDTAILGSSIGTTSAVITLDGQQHVGTLTFNNTTASPGAYTLSTGTAGVLVLDNGAATANIANASTTTAANIISAPLYVQSNSAITVAGGTLSITGGVTGGGNLTLDNNTSATALTLSTGLVNPSGTITNAGTGTGATAISAAIGVNVAGIIENSPTSPLSLGGINVFTSPVLISAGTLNANSSNALGVPSAPITLGVASGTLAASLIGGSSATFGNPITLAPGDTGTLTIGNNGAAATVFSGTISGTNDLTLANTSTGSVTLSGSVNPGGSITNSSTGSGTNLISGVIGASTSGVTQNSSTSALTLSGVNLYTTPTTITAGTLNVTNLTQGGVPSSLGASSNAASNLIIAGGTLAYTGTTATTTDRFFTLGNAGGENGGISAAGATSAATVTFSNTSPITFGDTNAHTFTLTGTNTGANTFNPAISDGGSATSFTKSGTGTWVLPGSGNTYTGTTSITGGTLQVNAPTNGLGNSTSAISLAGGTLSLRNDGAGSNGTIVYGSTANPAGYNITIPQTTGTINVDHLTANTGNTVQLGSLAATTTGTTASQLNVTGGDGYTLQFNGDANFAYVMTLNPTTANLVLNSNVSTPHSVDVIGSGNTTVNGTFSITAGSIVKTGTGTFALANPASTYTAPTDIDRGIVNVASLANGASASALGKPGSGGAPAALLFGGGTLQYTGSSAVSTDRLFTLGDANGNSATLDASGSAAAATVAFTSAGAIAYPTANVTAPVLTLTGTNTGTNAGVNTFAPALADESASNLTSVSKTGSGTWAITGNNTYSGGTTITAGTCLANSASAASATGTGNVIVNGGTLGGSGNIAPAAGNSVSIAGPATLAPGLPSSIGAQLTIAGGTGVSLLVGGTFAIKTTSGNVSDSLALTGTGALTIAGGDTLALTSTDAGTFTIATWASGPTETGAFSSVLLNDVDQGSPLISSPMANESLYTYPTGTTVLYDNANELIQVGVAAVPEPASLGLLAVASFGLLRRRRRSRVFQTKDTFSAL